MTGGELTEKDTEINLWGYCQIKSGSGNLIS